MFDYEEKNIVKYNDRDAYIIYPEPGQTCFGTPFMKISDLWINGNRETEFKFAFNCGFLQFTELPFSFDENDVIIVFSG